MNHISKLPNLEPSIFSVMSALAHKHNAINLSQGFPNFKGDQKLIDLVSKAVTAAYIACVAPAVIVISFSG